MRRSARAISSISSAVSGPLRLVYQASGHDVETVIVDGRIVIENRTAQTVNEAAILAEAQAVARGRSGGPLRNRKGGIHSGLIGGTEVQ